MKPRTLNIKSGLTPAAADSGCAASLRARLAVKGASMQASLASPAAAAEPIRWTAWERFIMRNQTLLLVSVVILLIGCSQPIPRALPTPPSLPTTPSADPTPCLKPDPWDPLASGENKMFADLVSAQRVILFPIEVPIGWENQPEISGISYTQADNGERHLDLLYRPWKPSEEWPIVKMNIHFEQSSLSMVEALQDSLVNACAMTAVKVGDAQGFTFWDAGVGKSNAAALIWQRDDFKISIWLTSDEGGPTESEPHPLDTLLRQLAQSLKPLQSR